MALPTWKKQRGGVWTPGGDRDVIVVASVGEATGMNAEVVSRSPHEPTEEDTRRMVDQGLSPEECADDISILLARIRLDKNKELSDIMGTDRGSELSRRYVLERIESRLKQTKKTGGKYAVYTTEG